MPSTSSIARRLAPVWVALAAVVAIGVVVSLAVRGQSTASAGEASRFLVTAGADGCGSGWRDPQGGRQTFVTTNTGIAGIEVYLQNPKTGAVFLDIEGLGAGATHTDSVTLDDGTYRFVCLPADADPAYGPRITISGAGHIANATPGVVPVTRNDLIPAAKAYGAWIQAQLPTLIADTARLNTAVTSGDLTAARADWLPAHTVYETLGAAYGAFGELDTAINGAPASGRTALSDPNLTGFHKVEALLYSGAPAGTIAPHAARLLADVTRLKTEFATARVDPLDIGLRAHEILESALQFELTGAADAGSHTDLATVAANLSGTVEALRPLRGILATRYDLHATDAAIARARTLVDSFHSAGGAWRPLDSLSRANRERLDSAIGQAVELLAPVAAICDIRRQP